MKLLLGINKIKQLFKDDVPLSKIKGSNVKLSKLEFFLLKHKLIKIDDAV